jgi:hypothetical protein
MICKGKGQVGVHNHDTVAEARACYGVIDADTMAQARVYGQDRPNIEDVEADMHRMEAEGDREGTRRDEARKFAAKTRAESPKAQFKILAGYYATPSESDGQDLDFWRVDVPASGRWTGYVFVNRIIGGQKGALRIPRSTQETAKFRIAKMGLEASALAFAKALDACAHCRLPLTDDASRALGYGLKCATDRGLGDEWHRLDRKLNRKSSKKVSAK